MKLNRRHMAAARDWAKAKDKDLQAQIELAQRMLSFAKQELVDHRAKSDVQIYSEFRSYSPAELAARFTQWWAKKISK